MAALYKDKNLASLIESKLNNTAISANNQSAKLTILEKSRNVIMILT